MLNKPKFMSPSVNMQGNTVVDLNSETIPFSCIVDGNESIVAWQIIISKLEDNSVVFDSGKQILDTPFYPINNRNQNVVFSVNLKDYFASALYYVNFVNSSTPYYWSITLWGKSGSTVFGAEEVFYANSIPQTTIYYSYDNNFLDDSGNLNSSLVLGDNTSLSKRKVFLKASFYQREGISLKRYGWRLTDTSNGVVIIDTITQNQIYGVEDYISCECNGLVNKTNYRVELYVETQNGQFGILNNVKFNVDYVVKNIEADFEIEALNNTSGIMLNWGNLRTTEGVVVGGDVSYTVNHPIISYDSQGNPNGSVSIEIPNDSSVVFSGTANGKDLDIDEDSYVVLSFQFDKNKNITLFEMSGVDDISNAIIRRLSYTYSDNTLIYTVEKGDIVAHDSVVLSDISGERCWYVVTLYPLFSDNGYYTDLKVVESVAQNSLFPSDSLYPSEELYPYLGEWDKIREG